ncbi:MAG TPA: hypothetical protein VFB06_37740 [Streptosporangiaceae bacterium]|nr:hypothetical protein [Streptosporangiaceae bacterium]
MLDTATADTLTANGTAEAEHPAGERVRRVAELRRQGRSTRQIAEEVGVCHRQVTLDLRRAVALGMPVVPPGGVVIGRDGKRQPARRLPAGGPKHNGRPRSVAAPQALWPVFDAVPLFREALCLGQAFALALDRAAASAAGLGLWPLPRREVEGGGALCCRAALDELLSQLALTQTAAVCRACHGEGRTSAGKCGPCAGRGWLLKGLPRRQQ